jgi:formate dehydrogenase subunit beta
MTDIQQELRQTCRRLLEDKTIAVAIGYGAKNPAVPDGETVPIFVTRPEDADRLVWNARCLANLTVYLKRKEIRALGKPGIVVKGCDARTLLVLRKESQIAEGSIFAIGAACEGVGDPRAPKCAACDVHMPSNCDIVVGSVDNPPLDPELRYAELAAFLEKTQPERWQHWKEEFLRCTRCYACRQVCPLCYCEVCLVDKNRPVRIGTSATIQGNFAYHIMRAFHLAARCVECEECTRACPAGINLRLLNQSLARAAEEFFHYRAGIDPEAEPLIGSYSKQDQEDFIQ